MLQSPCRVVSPVSWSLNLVSAAMSESEMRLISLQFLVFIQLSVPYANNSVLEFRDGLRGKLCTWL